MTNQSEHRYVPMTFNLDTDLYHVASYLLGKLDCSVEQFSALCMLKMVRHMQNMPEITKEDMHVLIRKVVDEISEELELCYVNKPQNLSKTE